MMKRLVRPRPGARRTLPEITEEQKRQIVATNQQLNEEFNRLKAQAQSSTPSMREQRAKRMAELGKDKDQAKQAEQKPALYPNATRVSPDAKASGKTVKQSQRAVQLRGIVRQVGDAVGQLR